MSSEKGLLESATTVFFSCWTGENLGGSKRLFPVVDYITKLNKKSILLLYILENADELVVKIPRPLFVVIERRDPGFT